MQRLVPVIATAPARAMRALVVAAVLGGLTLTATPQAAAAATVDVNGVVVAPVGIWDPYGISYIGVMLDGALGLAEFSLVPTRRCDMASVRIATADGSSLNLTASRCGFQAPNPIRTISYQLTAFGGTGRFAGATGSGVLQATEVYPVAPYSPGAIAVAPALVGTVTIQITTP